MADSKELKKLEEKIKELEDAIIKLKKGFDAAINELGIGNFSKDFVEKYLLTPDNIVVDTVEAATVNAICEVIAPVWAAESNNLDGGVFEVAWFDEDSSYDEDNETEKKEFYLTTLECFKIKRIDSYINEIIRQRDFVFEFAGEEMMQFSLVYNNKGKVEEKVISYLAEVHYSDE